MLSISKHAAEKSCNSYCDICFVLFTNFVYLKNRTVCEIFFVYFTMKQNVSPLHSRTDVSLHKPVMLPYVYLPQGGG